MYSPFALPYEFGLCIGRTFLDLVVPERVRVRREHVQRRQTIVMPDQKYVVVVQGQHTSYRGGGVREKARAEVIEFQM